MNVRLSKAFRVPAILIDDDQAPLVNFYNIIVQMTTLSEDAQDINCAFERVKYWIHEIFQNSVITTKDDSNITAWQGLGLKVLALPDDPVDQLVGIMIALKLNAICESRLSIDDLSISSSYEDDMVYHHHHDEAIGPFACAGWWSDHRPIWHDTAKKMRQTTKVINLSRNQEWKDLGLAWPTDSADSQIVIADFCRDEKQ